MEGADIPELSENCGTSHLTTAASESVAWTMGGDLHLSITGGSVSREPERGRGRGGRGQRGRESVSLGVTARHDQSRPYRPNCEA